MKAKILVAMAAATLVVSACSSATSSSSGSSSASQTVQAAHKVTVGRFTFPSGQATGSVIKIGLVNSNNQIPQVVKAAQAAVNYVNAKLDGIAGHKIELSVCDEMSSAAAASACTPQFVQDKVAAVIGYPLVWLSIGGLKGLAAANIPYLGVGQGDAQSAANSYPMFGGTIQELNFGTQYKALGIKTLNVLDVNFPANIQSINGIDKSVWSSFGVTVGKTVFYTSGAADVTTPAQQATAGDPDGIYMGNGPQDVARTAAAIRQAGYKGVLFQSYSALTPQLFPAAASVLKDNVTETGQLLYFDDPTNPEVALMHTILGSIPADSFAQVGVAQVLTLADMGNHIGPDLTGQAFLNYLKNVHGQKVFMGYQMDISQVPLNEPQLSHITNPFSRFMIYNGKTWVYKSGWVSVFGTAKPGVGAGS